mmetsp:Transcript_24158/g.54246  ORF Transcript_24158/g.54246 Transcript_24158/m.54246 type:complete len:290 (+) Transcript_24158:206-1075(+)
MRGHVSDLTCRVWGRVWGRGRGDGVWGRGRGDRVWGRLWGRGRGGSICRNMMPCSAMMLDNSSLPALPHLAAYLACASPPFSPSTAARTVPGAERQSSSDAGCTILCARRSCAMAAPNSFSCVCSSARCSSTTAAAAAPPCSCTCAALCSACSREPPRGKADLIVSYPYIQLSCCMDASSSIQSRHSCRRWYFWLTPLSRPNTHVLFSCHSTASRSMRLERRSSTTLRRRSYSAPSTSTFRTTKSAGRMLCLRNSCSSVTAGRTTRGPMAQKLSGMVVAPASAWLTLLS